MAVVLNNALPELVERLADRILAEKLLLATAESFTNGWIAEARTTLAGSSNWFNNGFES